MAKDSMVTSPGYIRQNIFSEMLLCIRQSSRRQRIQKDSSRFIYMPPDVKFSSDLRRTQTISYAFWLPYIRCKLNNSIALLRTLLFFQITTTRDQTRCYWVGVTSFIRLTRAQATQMILCSVSLCLRIRLNRGVNNYSNSLSLGTLLIRATRVLLSLFTLDTNYFPEGFQNWDRVSWIILESICLILSSSFRRSGLLRIICQNKVSREEITSNILNPTSRIQNLTSWLRLPRLTSFLQVCTICQWTTLDLLVLRRDRQLQRYTLEGIQLLRRMVLHLIRSDQCWISLEYRYWMKFTTLVLSSGLFSTWSLRQANINRHVSSLDRLLIFEKGKGKQLLRMTSYLSCFSVSSIRILSMVTRHVCISKLSMPSILRHRVLMKLAALILGYELSWSSQNQCQNSTKKLGSSSIYSIYSSLATQQLSSVRQKLTRDSTMNFWYLSSNDILYMRTRLLAKMFSTLLFLFVALLQLAKVLKQSMNTQGGFWKIDQARVIIQDFISFNLLLIGRLAQQTIWKLLFKFIAMSAVIRLQKHLLSFRLQTTSSWQSSLSQSRFSRVWNTITNSLRVVTQTVYVARAICWRVSTVCASSSVNTLLAYLANLSPNYDSRFRWLFSLRNSNSLSQTNISNRMGTQLTSRHIVRADLEFSHSVQTCLRRQFATSSALSAKWLINIDFKADSVNIEASLSLTDSLLIRTRSCSKIELTFSMAASPWNANETLLQAAIFTCSELLTIYTTDSRPLLLDIPVSATITCSVVILKTASAMRWFL